MHIFKCLVLFLVAVDVVNSIDNKTEKNFSEQIASDNFCNNHEKNVAFDVVVIDSRNADEKGTANILRKRFTRSLHHDEREENRPTADQKSLLIIFDGTG